MTINDRTQYQSDEDRIRSRDLSLQTTKPPAKVHGYSVEQFIGSGAYGEVWSGTEKKTGRRVAIKFYTRRSSDDVRLLAREVEKLIALSADRYVVQLVDVDWDADPPYFVMDYFEHGSLEDLLRKQQTLPVAQALDLFREIATGMLQLHGKGIFHCDLKPGNILLDQDSKPRLADFGQARLKTDEAPSLGTLFFMAPEQADLKAVPAAKWDVFALGALFYCMLVGKPPYHCQQLTEKIESSTTVEERLTEYQQALRTASPPTDHRRVAGVDRMLAEIIDQAITVNPKYRFDSVQSILFALRQRELANARKPLLVLGILGPLLLLAVMSLFSWYAYRQAHADTHQAIHDKAVESIEFAARLAARTASEKIDQYFRAVEELARNEQFVNDLLAALNDPELAELAQQLDDPSGNADPALDKLRADYVANPARAQLQPYLKWRIENLHHQYPRCSSWFVSDLRGNQLASAYETEPETNTIGRNYSYRSYFTGFHRDQVSIEGGTPEYEVEPWGSPRAIIDRPHLSAVFLSRGTYTWKVAFSVPVYRETVGAESEVIALVACTAEMGHFVEFDNGSFQYAALIDARPGDNTGAVLEHPIFNQAVLDPQDLPRVNDIPNIRTSGRFNDPFAKLPQGQQYDRDWIATLEPVVSSRSGDARSSAVDANNGEDQRSESGLLVLVAEDLAVVIEPVRRLSTRLIRIALFATIFFLTVAAAMWILVYRMFKENNAGMANYSAIGDSSFRTNSEPRKV